MAMSTRIAAPGKSTRRWLAGGTAAALMTLSIPFLALPSASAAAGDTFGPFEIDGDLASQGVTDWGNVGVGNVVTVLDNKNTTSNQDATTFQSNSKEYDAVGSNNGWPNWTYGAANNAADKTDFGRVAIYNTTVGTGSAAVQWTYVGFDRGSATGTGKFAVELNQIKQAGLNANPLRSEGDVRFIVWDQGNGAITLVGDASNPDVGAYVWDDPDSTTQGFADSNSNGNWKKFSNAAAAANFKGAVNSAAVTVPSWWTSNNVVSGKVGTDQFVEFGFNLTGLGATLGCPSQGFKAWNMRSLTGTGNTGALKDYIEAQSINIRSTCGTLVLTKESIDGTGLAGAEFTITPDPTPGSSADSLTVTTGADGTVTVSPAVPGDYTITETKAPLGYILVPWTQEITLDDSGTATYLAVNPLGDIRWTKKYEGYTDTFPQGFTGQQFTVKRVDGIALTNAQFAAISGITATNCAASGCEFTVRDNQVGVDQNSAFGTIRVNGLPVGTYEITETAGGQPAGFGPDSATAEATIPSFLAEAPTNDAGDLINYLTTATVEGSTAATTFTNPRLKGWLGVKKLNQAGTTALAGAQYTLYKVVGTKGGGDDTTVGSCTTGADGICYVPALASAGAVEWGVDYYFVETAPPAGYNISDNPVGPTVSLTAAQVTAQHAGAAVNPATVPVTEFRNPQTVVTTKAQGNQGSAEGYSLSLPTTTKLFDQSTITGITDPVTTDQIPVGTVTYYLYEGVAPFCTSLDVGFGGLVFKAGPYAITQAGTHTMPQADGYVPTKAGTYYWHAVFTSNYPSLVRSGADECGSASERVIVTKSPAGIGTIATPQAQLSEGGVDISDTVTITGLTSNAVGTVRVWLSGIDGVCKPAGASPTFVKTIGVGGDYPVVSGPDGYYVQFTVTAKVYQAGTYNWQAEYLGDDNNDPVSHACGADNGDTLQEVTVVEPADPTIATVASAVGGDRTLPGVSVTDVATVDNVVASPGETNVGSVTFRLYGPFTDATPADDTCSTAIYTSSAIPLTASGGAWTASVPTAQAVTDAGRYRWIASYSGDEDNNPVAGECIDAAELVTVEKAQPAIITKATPTVELGAGDAGAQISDTATISGLTPNAGGDVTFELFGPFETADDIVCSTSIEEETKALTTPVNGSVTITSSTFTVYDVGIYAWKATYSGDANNNGVTHECGLVDRVNNERSTVTPTTPELVTFATQSATLAIADGATVGISDEATITGLSENATGTVTFELYGPNDEPVCDASEDGNQVAVVNVGSIAGKVDASGKVVIGSGDIAVSAPGTYWWIARYASGDSNNPSLAGECGDANESTLVTQGEPGIAKVVELPKGTPITGAVEVGKILHYTVTVSNTGSAPATDDVTDVLPEGLGAPTNITNGGTYNAATRTITWTQVTVQGGDAIELEYDAQVLPSAAAVGKDTLINVASWFDISATTTTKVKWITVVATPFCEVETGTPKVTYAITTHNLSGINWTADLEWVYADGPNAGQVVDPADVPTTQDGVQQNLSGVQLSGTLLYPGTKTVGGSAVDWPGWKNVGTADAPIWQVDGDGLKPSVILRATVNPTAESVAIYPAAAAECNPPGVPLLDKSSPTEKTETQSGEVLPGETVDYTITLTNNGGQVVTSDLVDTLPDGVTPVDGTFSPADPDDVTGQTLTWSDVTLQPGQTLTVTFQVTVDADVAAGDLVNTAEWAGLSDQTVHVVTPGEPGLDKSSPTERTETQDGNVVPGSKIHYVVTLTNTGGATVVSDLVDTLPAGVTPVAGSFTPDAPDSIVGQVLTWNDVAVKGGESVVYEFDVTVDVNPGAGELVELVNDATWAELDDQTLHLVAGPGVEITPTLDKDSNPVPGTEVAIGSVITYTIKVGNDGNVAITDDLVDTLPAGIEVVGNYTRDDGGKAEPDSASATELVWNDVTVQPGQVVTFTYEIKVLSAALDADSLVNTAEWFELTDEVEHTVKQPDLPVTGASVNPFAVAGWAGALLGLGLLLLLTGRTRRENKV